MVLSFFFFFKQKTAYEMRISDWSSDVCSSDLTRTERIAPMLKTLTDDILVAPQISVADVEEAKALGVKLVINNRPDHESPDQPEGNEIEEAAREIGRASCRERVCQYV